MTRIKAFVPALAFGVASVHVERMSMPRTDERAFLTVEGIGCRRERALSVDIRHEARGMDFLQYMGDSSLSKLVF